jgi:16S rRNA (cytosine1402-N4)-methyltransferase
MLHPRRFSEMVGALAEAGIARVDGVVMDIGVSSMQLDQAERGFAFSADGPLDMTMDRSHPNAADFLNAAREEEIADVLYHYGEERQSRRVARAIVAARPLTTTGELAQVVRKSLGYHPGAPKDPATRSFQAIRIHVNAELDELEQGLQGAEQLLKAGGRLAVVSFHSLEDRIVKRFLREAAGATAGASRHRPARAAGAAPTFAHVARAVRPSEVETPRNPRARSATLRAAVRTDAPARLAA